MNGETCAIVVSDLDQNDEPIKDHPYGMIIWSNN